MVRVLYLDGKMDLDWNCNLGGVIFLDGVEIFC